MPNSIDIETLEREHRCFRMEYQEGKTDCFFFIGEHKTERGVKKYGLCRMVYKPTPDDIFEISEQEFTRLLEENKVELF
jgi:hypothetical protein